MTLPKASVPTYKTKLPSTNKEIKFRPFLVKEEKAIMIAFQDPSNSTLYETIKNVISSCTFDQLDVDNLPLIDLEYLFLQLRIKSKGSFVEVAYRCEHPKQDGSACGTVNEVTVDLTAATVEKKKEVSNKIMLDPKDKFGVILKYPTLSTLKDIEDLSDTKDINKVYGVFSKFIDTIFKGEEAFEAKDHTEEELTDWLESLTDSQFTLIKDFFEGLPKLKLKFKPKCSACGHEEEVELEGLKSFLE